MHFFPHCLCKSTQKHIPYSLIRAPLPPPAPAHIPHLTSASAIKELECLINSLFFFFFWLRFFTRPLGVPWTITLPPNHFHKLMVVLHSEELGRGSGGPGHLPPPVALPTPAGRCSLQCYLQWTVNWWHSCEQCGTTEWQLPGRWGNRDACWH